MGELDAQNDDGRRSESTESQNIEALLGGSRMLARRLTSAPTRMSRCCTVCRSRRRNHLVGNLVAIGKNESLEKAVGMSLRI